MIPSERTPRRERDIADHPSIKPQSFMRQIVYAALPLGVGIIADPFMGSGSTIAAAVAEGVQAVGVERHEEYYRLALEGIPQLAALKINAVRHQFELLDEEIHQPCIRRSSYETAF